MDVRRVVTGTNAEGKAEFVSDELVAPITLDLVPGYEFHRLWGADETVELPTDGKYPTPAWYFPDTNGFRFGFFTIAPDSTAMPPDLDIGAALTQMETDLPGMAAHMEPDAPGMHTTDTVDYELVVSGRVVLELDDGATRELGPGDTVVQNGTRHAWRNPFDEPCQMLVVLVGAHRA
jgi:mannose-6-phosphate isomerase-like protein (cupin superfamily)